MVLSMNRKARITIFLLLAISMVLCTVSDTEAKKLRYHYVDVGTLGGRFSWGNGINNWGQVVGVSETENREFRGFLWNGREIKNLGSFDEDILSGAWSINDRGQAAGFTVSSDNRRHGVFWDRKGIHELETLGGSENDALGINVRGEIVGWASTPDEALHAVLWDSEGVADLHPLQAVMSWAWSINRRAEVVGAILTPDNYLRAVLWSDEGMQELGTLGGDESEAFGINDRGDIVGWCDLPGDVWHACVWDSSGELIDLGALDGLYSEAYSINERGQVVGVYYLDSKRSQPRPFLWTQEQEMVDLNALAELPEGVTLVQALAINEFGWISATNSLGTACLLIPYKSHKHKGHHKHSPTRSLWLRD